MAADTFYSMSQKGRVIRESNNRHYCVRGCVSEIKDFDTSSVGQVAVVFISNLTID